MEIKVGREINNFFIIYFQLVFGYNKFCKIEQLAYILKNSLYIKSILDQYHFRTIQSALAAHEESVLNSPRR